MVNSCLNKKFALNHAVLKVTVKEETGNDVSLTVRLYGPNTDYVINRERELQVIVLTYCMWLCVKLYAFLCLL